MTVKAVLKDGIITALDHTKIQQFKASLKEGDYVELSFKRWSNSRTLRQNRYLHALFNRIVSSLGMAMSQVKDMMCIEYGVAESWDNFVKDPVKDYTIRVCEYKGIIFVRKSTADYTAPEFVPLIDNVRLWMDENHITHDDLKPEE